MFAVESSPVELKRIGLGRSSSEEMVLLGERMGSPTESKGFQQDRNIISGGRKIGLKWKGGSSQLPLPRKKKKKKKHFPPPPPIIFLPHL